MAGGSARFLPAHNAAELTAQVAKGALRVAAAAVEQSIPAHVPVVHGIAVATYRPSTHELGDGYAVETGSPLWHLLEYGTAYTPAYRPVERAVRGLGLRWRAQ